MKLPGRATFATAGAGVVMAIVAALPAHEGRKYTPYWDSIGRVWTVCAGVTGSSVIPNHTYTPAECDNLESKYVQLMLGNMGKCVHAELEFHEIKAWGDFAYNVGTRAFCRSSAVSLLNAGKNKAACAVITEYVYAGGLDCRLKSSKCAGIVTRRQWERSVCEGGQ